MNKMKCILIVDDDPGIVKIVSLKLKLSGFEVIGTTNGAEAIELIKKQRPDVVLLDIVMPEVTGIDILYQVRHFSRVPVIAFTAKDGLANLAIKHGATDFISKPFDPDALVKKITSLL